MDARQQTSRNCPNCGMSLADASNLTMRNGLQYCCEECSAGGDCTCPAHRHSATAAGRTS
jgi:hypothetical protein